MVGLVDVEEAAGGLRPEIASSWRRTQLSGLDPSAPLGRLSLADVDTASRLMVAAAPVLDEIARTLEQTRFSVILADRDSRVVDLRYGERRLESAMEHVGAVRGRLFSEETTGTNSIATPYETRRGVAVHGPEHYLESFKKFSCYGHPILHPVTRRLEGVLDITCLTEDDNPLLAPYLIRAAQDIEARLLEGSRRAEQRLLASYQAAAKRDHPVLVLGDGVVLASPVAVDLLQAADHAVLRAIASAAPDGRRRHQQVKLACGAVMRVEFERIPGTGGGLLFELEPDESARSAAPRGAARPASLDSERRIRSQRLSVLVTGEPGSGRTTVVRRLAGPEPVREFSAVGHGESAWLERLAGSLSEPAGLTVLDDVHLLPPTVALRAARLLEGAAGWYAITSVPSDRLDEEQAGLAAHCLERIDLPPLRQRIDELPQLVKSMLGRNGADPSVRFTASALEALASCSWPGNLRELDSVVRETSRRRTAGDVTVRDLPEAYRARARARRLTALEQAERDAIVTALRACGGNKVHTAERLGISRTTLYSRIRALGIVA